MEKLTWDEKLEINRKRTEDQSIPYFAKKYGALISNIKYLVSRIENMVEHFERG